MTCTIELYALLKLFDISQFLTYDVFRALEIEKNENI